MRSHLTRRVVLGGLGATAIMSGAAGAMAAPAPRIISLDWGVTQTLVALGAPPVATPDLRGYRANVVEPVLPGSVIDIGLRTEPNLELMVELKPDLLLIPPGYRVLQATFERIAKVEAIEIYGSPSPLLPRIETVTATLAKLVSREAQGEMLRDENRRALRSGAVAMSAGRRMQPLRLLDERHAQVFGRRSLFAAVMEGAGRTVAWQGQTNAWGFTTIGTEQLASLAGSVFVSIGSDPVAIENFRRGSLWSILERAGSDLVVLPPIWAFGTLPSALRLVRLFATS